MKNRSKIINTCLLGLLFIQCASAVEQKKRVLILHAYHQGFHWTDRIMAGIQSVFNEHDSVELFIDYMDTKRRSDDDYLRQLRDLYATKYQLINFDAIISSDDHALDFLLKYRDEIFPDTPVIFSGLNEYPPNRLAGQKGYTGIYESYDVAGTIDLMLKIHPNTQTIAAVTDDTRSGNIFKSLIKKSESNLTSRVKINYLHNLSQSDLKQALSQQPENSLVLWAIYLRMPNGTTLASKESVQFVSKNSRYPTYCVWDVVGQGVVGGKITSPNFQGETAARFAMRVINGEAIDKIPVVGSPLDHIFDFYALQRFDIAIEKLPSSSIILSKPESFYEQYKRFVWVYSAIIILLLIALVFLITIIWLKRKRDQFEGMAMRDQLTGLYNRHYLQEMAAQKLSESSRYQQPLCLLVLDIDFFKEVNDIHGHLVGDSVLKIMAKLLNSLIRAEDIVARIGGEEFVILLDRCSDAEGEEKAQLIRNRVAKLKPNGISLTVSIGFANLNLQGETYSELLARADKALFQAKEGGRNRVVRY